MLLLIAMLCAILGGAALGALRPGLKALRPLAVGLTTLTSALALLLVLRGMEPCALLDYAPGFSLCFALDGRGRVLLTLMALLWPLSTLYATGYMAHEERESTFYMWFLIAYGVMLAFSCAANLFTLYILYECVTLTTLPLVWHKKDYDSVRAARAYVRYTFGCAAFGFLAVVMLGERGSVDFIRGGHAFAAISDRLLNALFVTAFLGFGVKAAVFPFSNWLPKAGAAPTPVTALLHAVAVVNAGVFAVQRVIYDVFPASRLQGGWGQQVALAASALTIVYGAGMALREHLTKRRLAYSTVSNLGYMLLGAALMTGAGEQASLLHMVTHSLTKIVLFFCVGAVMVQTGRTQVAQMRGVGTRLPMTMGAFLVASLALMGIPPLAGFASKYALIMASVEEGGLWAVLGPGALIFSTVLTAAYTLTIAMPAFLAPGEALSNDWRDPDWRMLAPILVILAAMLAAGLWPQALMDALRF